MDNNIPCYVKRSDLKDSLTSLVNDPSVYPELQTTIFSYDVSTCKVMIAQHLGAARCIQTALLTPDQAFRRAKQLISIAEELEEEYFKSFPVQAAKDGEPSCVTCAKNAPQAALVPCGHYGFCGKCCINLTSCPTCSAKVDKVLRLSM